MDLFNRVKKSSRGSPTEPSFPEQQNARPSTPNLSRPVEQDNRLRLSNDGGDPNISIPVNLIGPDGSRRRREDAGAGRRSTEMQSERETRPSSPDALSIRSVDSSAKSAGDIERRRRTESSTSAPRTRDSIATTSSGGGGTDPFYRNSSSTGDPSRRFTPSLLSGRVDSPSLRPYANSPSIPPATTPNLNYTSASHNNTISSRTSTSTAASVRSPTVHSFDSSMSMSIPTPSPSSEEFDFPRPASNQDIDLAFEELLPRIVSTPALFEKMRNLDPDKKWTLLFNDAFKTWKAAREKLTHRPVDGRSAPAVGSTLASLSEERSERLSTVVERPGSMLLKGKDETPQWYISRFMNSTITTANVASLGVSLRTYGIE